MVVYSRQNNVCGLNVRCTSTSEGLCFQGRFSSQRNSRCRESGSPWRQSGGGVAMATLHLCKEGGCSVQLCLQSQRMHEPPAFNAPSRNIQCNINIYLSIYIATSFHHQPIYIALAYAYIYSQALANLDFYSTRKFLLERSLHSHTLHQTVMS